MNSHRTDITLYNTLTKSKQRFEPLDENNVRMYVCGPTVYDYAHIGNARPAIVFDVLFRLLRHTYGENNVTYVRNITDVDDKINARAARDFPDLPLNDAIRKLTSTTENQYRNDMAALGCLDPNEQPRATDNIGVMIEMIQILINKKHAYVADGHVLFAVKSYEKYGALARRSLDDMIAGARVEVASYKRNDMDFVLWKPSANNEPGWDSPWGRGRPGWHIECSAMSKKILGETFDIHGGGIDLSFPHHENELAQSVCANGNQQMAQIWMHNGFLQVEGQKMSKSEGNFFTVDELLNTNKFGGRKWPGPVLRLAMLMTHYRKPIDFSIARLEEADIELAKFKTVVGFINYPVKAIDPEFLTALGRDLDTRAALANLVQLRDQTGSDARESKIFAGLAMLGIDLGKYDREWLKKQRNKPEEKQIAARLKALATKDFATADKIRADLLEQGIQLMDYKDPETGEKRTKWEVKR